VIRPKLGSASYVGSFAVANILVAYRHGLSVFELVDLRWVQVEFQDAIGRTIRTFDKRLSWTA
jgi:hypothetical protein